MAGRSISWTTVLLGTLLAAAPDARAEERPRSASTPADQIANVTPCIRTDRLSPKQLRVWKAIEGIVLAEDGFGRPRHQKLHSLWQWIETSGHVVQVELADPKSRGDRQAGEFMIVKSDPGRQKYLAVIRLCLPVIDEALIRKRARGANDFVRFEGLGKRECYAEILGHELAHAVWVLGDQNHVRLLEDLNREVEEYDRCRRRAVHCGAWDEHGRQVLRRIESLKTEIERPAEAAEKEIWQELLQSRRGKSEVTVTNAAGRTPGKALNEVVVPEQGVLITSTRLTASLLSTN
jgi:hypothetical protein